MNAYSRNRLTKVPNETIFDNDDALMCKPVKNELWIYFVILVSISAIFLLMSIVTLLLIREKHRTQGWTQFSYLCASFLFNIVFIPALSPFTPTQNGSFGSCYMLSALNQYFFVSSKTWLLIMSIDIYRRIRAMRAVQFNKARMTRFLIYSIIGWISPAIFVGTGVIINICNRNEKSFRHTTQGLWAPVPDYGCGHCRIPDWNVWECFVMANCVFHIFMFGLIIFTIFKQRQNFQTLQNGTTRRKQSPFALLARLFIVVGLNWSYIAVQDIVGAGNINTSQSGWWHAFRTSFFLQGVFVSVVLLSNERTWKCLEDKYPQLKVIHEKISQLSKRLNIFKNENVRKDSIQSCASNATISTIAC